MDVSGPLSAYHSAMPPATAGLGFSIQVEAEKGPLDVHDELSGHTGGTGNLIAVQLCCQRDHTLRVTSREELHEVLQNAASEVSDSIDCYFDMRDLVGRGLHVWMPPE